LPVIALGEHNDIARRNIALGAAIPTGMDEIRLAKEAPRPVIFVTAEGDEMDGGRHRFILSACHSLKALACVLHRSLPGAGDVLQLVHIRLSQVPPGTFQSQRSGADRPHAQRGPPAVQTMAQPPFGKATCSQAINPRLSILSGARRCSLHCAGRAGRAQGCIGSSTG
jgi:hypothetical protein